MKKENVERLVQLRDYIINYYNKLDRNSPGISMTKTAEIAYLCESLISSVDDIIKPHVNFSEK